MNVNGPMRTVLRATGQPGRRWWLLKLACGHTEQRQIHGKGSKQRPAPHRVHCTQCFAAGIYR